MCEYGSKIYSLANGKLIKYIYTEYNYINCILPWLNKVDKKDYIIQISDDKIYINNVNEDVLYSELSVEGDGNFIGFIYNKNDKDHLCVSSACGKVYIWDIIEKKIFKIINVGDIDFNIIKWNNRYAIGIHNGLKIIDIENGNVVSAIKKQVYYLKKINHPIYGESLITYDKKNFSLWTL